MILPRVAFRLTQGTLATWKRLSDLGTINRANFCPTCGVRIFHDGGEETAEISVKAGSLDDTSVLTPAAHIWTKRAQPWMHLSDDVLQYEGEPESDDELHAVYRDRKSQ